MKVFALVGKTGTGKSFYSLDIARENNIEAIIDDGLLISNGRILAGSSAKHEKTRMASVKRAIFIDNNHANSVKQAIIQNNIESILVLGTSGKMVKEISKRLTLPEFEKIFQIEDIATPEDIEKATIMRNKYGKHIIPAPVFEVKSQFSGYFLKSLFSGQREKRTEKTVMRPTYSYMGSFRISPKVFSDICNFEVLKIDSVNRVIKVQSTSDANGCVDIYIEVSLTFPCTIPTVSEHIQKTVQEAIEISTSIIVNSVDVNVKSINFL